MTAITAVPTELATMREVVETLAPIERAAGEPGEHQAAHWIVERLFTAGCTRSAYRRGAVLRWLSTAARQAGGGRGRGCHRGLA